MPRMTEEQWAEVERIKRAIDKNGIISGEDAHRLLALIEELDGAFDKVSDERHSAGA